jgi:hypothetical protein
VNETRRYVPPAEKPVPDQMYACLRCGLASWDVKMKLVIVPEEERRAINVPIETEVRKGLLPEVEYREVTELYAREPRCRDTAGCDERVAAYQLTQMAKPEPEEEPAKEWVI